MNRNKPNRNKKKIMFPLYLSLSSVIEKYSQISYLQRNEQNPSFIRQICRVWCGCLRGGGGVTSMAYLIRIKKDQSVHVKQRGRMNTSQQTIWLLLWFQHRHVDTFRNSYMSCNSLSNFCLNLIFSSNNHVPFLLWIIQHQINHSWDTFLKVLYYWGALC